MSLVKIYKYSTVDKADSLYLPMNLTRNKYEYKTPFKLSQNIGHEDPALHSFVDGVIVFKERKHVPAVLHSQTSDQLLHDLTTEHKQQCYWVTIRTNGVSKCSR